MKIEISIFVAIPFFIVYFIYIVHNNEDKAEVYNKTFVGKDSNETLPKWDCKSFI